jgi:hypothetical protein
LLAQAIEAEAEAFLATVKGVRLLVGRVSSDTETALLGDMDSPPYAFFAAAPLSAAVVLSSPERRFSRSR